MYKVLFEGILKGEKIQFKFLESLEFVEKEV